MGDEIVFYIYGSTIDYGGTLFDAGELSADILNIGPTDFSLLYDALQQIRSMGTRYEKTNDRSLWWKLNQCFIELRSQLIKYRVFQILLQDDDQLFSEAQQYTEQLAFFSEKELDWGDVSSEQWLSMVSWDEADGAKPAHLLIFPSGRKDKWLFYKMQISRYQHFLEDVAVFNSTIRNFIDYVLSKLEHNTPSNYAAALYQFYNDDALVDHLIVNFTNLESPYYQKYDNCAVSYLPKELPNGEFVICQEHTTDSLQMLLKADFMTALNSGHNIRQCIACKKYFLVRGGAHVLYCEGQCPLDKRFTCRQFGSYEIQKELSRDVPKIRAKLAAFSRIRKDQQRGVITDDEMRRLKDTVRDMLYDALNNPNVSNVEFERSISSARLYPACGVVRQTKPRGRPSKKKGGDPQ